MPCFLSMLESEKAFAYIRPNLPRRLLHRQGLARPFWIFDATLSSACTDFPMEPSSSPKKKKKISNLNTFWIERGRKSGGDFILRSRESTLFFFLHILFDVEDEKNSGGSFLMGPDDLYRTTVIYLYGPRWLSFNGDDDITPYVNHLGINQVKKYLM